jgi:hypothetical protein
LVVTVISCAAGFSVIVILAGGIVPAGKLEPLRFTVVTPGSPMLGEAVGLRVTETGDWARATVAINGTTRAGSVLAIFLPEHGLAWRVKAQTKSGITRASGALREVNWSMIRQVAIEIIKPAMRMYARSERGRNCPSGSPASQTRW